jgi:hypothetical protein
MRPGEKLWVLVLVLCAGVSSSNLAYSQDERNGLPDSPSESARLKHAEDVEREVSWRSIPNDFLHDQKGIWLFPTQLAKGRHWVPTLAIVGGTAVLLVADPHIMREIWTISTMSSMRRLLRVK